MACAKFNLKIFCKMIESKGKSKNSMLMGVLGVAFGEMVGIIAADMVKKNFLNKSEETA